MGGRALQASVVPWAYLQGCVTTLFLSQCSVQMQPNSSLFQEGDKGMAEISGGEELI